MLKFILTAILILASILYIVMPFIYGWYGSLRYQSYVGQPPKGFDNITLTTSDGVELKAWYLPPRNGAVILLCHGSPSSRNGVRYYADMLANNGFGVLAYDMRGQGESGGEGNALGWQCISDVGAAIDFLKSQKDVEEIGGLGTSMGGQTLLGAASTYPEIKAIISDGATHRSFEDYLALPFHRNLIRSWHYYIMYTSLRIFTKHTPPIQMLDSMKNAEITKFLLIAGGKVKEEIKYNTCFYNAVADRADLWIAPNAEHISACYHYPEEYEKRVVDFFNNTLFKNN